MTTIEESVEIAASPGSVTDVLLDVDAAPLWTSGLERLELVAGVAGQPGSVGLAHYREGGRRYTIEDRLLEVTLGRYFKSEIGGGGLRATVETTLETVAAGTRMTIRWSGTGTNPLTKVMLPLMKKSIRRRSQEDLQALRRLVEAREAEGSGMGEGNEL